MKKNVFFTFCFSCLPGTGAMYLGYRKRGLSQLILFCSVFTLVVWFYLEGFIMMLPVIFAYCFFDTWGLYNQTPEQAAENPDAYIINVQQLGGDEIKVLLEQRRTIIGWGCLAIAILLLYNNVFMLFLMRSDLFRSPVVSFVADAIPTLALIAALVLLGLYLLRGPRATRAKFDASKDEYVAYTSTHADNAAAMMTQIAEQAEVPHE